MQWWLNQSQPKVFKSGVGLALSAISGCRSGRGWAKNLKPYANWTMFKITFKMPFKMLHCPNNTITVTKRRQKSSIWRTQLTAKIQQRFQAEDISTVVVVGTVNPMTSRTHSSLGTYDVWHVRYGIWSKSTPCLWTRWPRSRCLVARPFPQRSQASGYWRWWTAFTCRNRFAALENVWWHSGQRWRTEDGTKKCERARRFTPLGQPAGEICKK